MVFNRTIVNRHYEKMSISLKKRDHMEENYPMIVLYQETAIAETHNFLSELIVTIFFNKENTDVKQS
jgi:hypothetical protein